MSLKKKMIAVVSSLLATALLITGAVIFSKQYRRNAEIERNAQKIASLQAPDFDSAFLENNKNKADFNALHALLLENRCVTWLFAGDSITHGCMHTGYWQNFEELFEKYIKLSADIRRNDIVINTGVSSATAADMTEHFEEWITQPDADAVFLCFGTNDCATDGMTTEIFKEHMLNAIHTLRAKGVIPILQTPNVSYRQEPLKPYVEEMRKIAEEENVLLIDVNKLWEDNLDTTADMLNDGLHPNAAGHIVWCRFLLQSLDMYSVDSELEKLTFDSVAHEYSPADRQQRIKLNNEVQSELSDYLNNTEPVVWTFVGGATTEGLALPYQARNYISHFNEIARWETATADMMYRNKAFINSGRSGYQPVDIYEHYNELIGRFHSDIVVYLPELADGTDGAALKENGAFYDGLMKLAEKTASDGIKLVILTNPAVLGENAALLKKASADACEKSGGLLLDTAAVLNATDWDADSPDCQFALARAIALTCYELPKDSRMR